MQLFVWLSVCVLLVIACRRHISLLAAVGFLLYLAVPSVARGLIVGPNTPMHPATVFIIIAVSWVALTKLRLVAATAVGSLGRTLLFVMLSLHAVLLTSMGTGSVGQLLNNLVGPLLLLGLVALSMRDEGRRVSYVPIIVGAALAQAALGLTQVVVGRTIFFEAYYAKFYWFNSEKFSRALGTLDSALDLALLLVVAIPLTVCIRANLARVAAVALLLGGVFATQSRLGVVLALLGAFYVSLSGETIKTRLATAVGLLVCATGLLLSRFGQGFLERAQNAAGSTMRRSEATDYILENFFNKVLIGGGLNSSYGLRSGGVLGSSLENGFAMYAFDFGWLASAGILLSLIYVFFSCFFRRDWGGTVVMLVLVTMQTGYSSFMTQSASGAVMFFLLGVLAGHMSYRKDTDSVCDGLEYKYQGVGPSCDVGLRIRRPIPQISSDVLR